MALAVGTKLGPYEIQSPLGAGGMGEVYRARDTRLDRTVAVKILPEHLSSQAEARERFEREARAISSLSHPNICHLYDVGEQDGTSYLVMEYLAGETLADRLRKGPLPLAQVLKCGIEICEGLEKAHHQGVLHRDLKPGNVMLTATGAKLMDFGLAKAMPAASTPASSLAATLEGRGHPLTAAGHVVGTFQYMSPEQVEGKEADARSDIFALGAVLHEMATGMRAFDGQSAASVIAAILEREPPPISRAQPTSPPALDELVRTCLAKNPEERWQSVHDVKLQLRRIAAGGSSASMPAVLPAKQRARERVAWLLAGLLFLALAAGSTAWWLRARQVPPAMYFNSSVPLSATDLAVAPDGRKLAMVAYSPQANKYVIWIYEMGARTATAVPGTEDANHPFWSPDSRSVGFFAQGKLKTIDTLSGSSPQVLCDAPHGRGGAWNRDGVILFAPEVSSGLYRISSAGGTPVEVTKPDRSLGHYSHRWPVFLPDGRHYLYLAANFSGEFEKNAIFMGSLGSDQPQRIVAASSNAAYAEPGYLLYVKDSALVAQAFDARSGALSGEPRTLSDGVQYFPETDLALFGVAGEGTLVVQTGKGVDKSQFTWFDRSGKQVGTAGPPGLITNPSLSPDGRRLAFEQRERDGRHVDIWIQDLGSDALVRLTYGPGLNELPVWDPGGTRIAYAAVEMLNWRVAQKRSDGSGPEQELSAPSDVVQGPWDLSRDGKNLLSSKSGELWYSSLPQPPRPLIQEKWTVRNAQFSPDGKWAAYSSNETGSWEIFISPFPGANSKWQVSRGGGSEPRWRRDGKELFYLSADGKLMAVSIRTGSSVEVGSPVALFQAHLRQPISAMDMVSYDVSADGQRFLVNTRVDESNAAPLSVILNWASLMQR